MRSEETAMTESLTDVDTLLLDRWGDTVGLRDAIKELEDRLADRLEAVAERLRPWLMNQGYVLLDVEKRYATVNVGKASWMKDPEEALIYISIASLFPFGYRRVDEEHPSVWLLSDGLPKPEQEIFQAEVLKRLKNRPEEWINEDCDQDGPAGRYIRSHGDVERACLAQSQEALEKFIKAELEPMLLLGGDFDAALEAARN